MEDAIAEGNLLPRRAGGTGSDAVWRPASGCVPSGGRGELAEAAATTGWGARRQLSRRVAAVVGDAPDPSMHVVGDIESAVRPDRQPGRPECRAAGILAGAGKAVGEDDVRSGRLALGHRLEDDVVAACASGARFHEPWKATNAPLR